MADGTGTPSTALPTASGSGRRMAGYSRILPGASGSISHARILKGERSPENAAYFHEIIREQTA